MKKAWFLTFLVCCLVTVGTLSYAGQPANELGQSPYGSAKGYVPGEILVRFNPEVDSVHAGALATDHGLSVEECIATINLCRMRVGDGTSELDAARRVGGDSRVRFAEPNYIDHVSGSPSEESLSAVDTVSLVPNDPKYRLQWHYKLINMPFAWERTKGSKSVVVAVVDTGVRFDHGDLAGRLSSNGYDFIGLDNDPTDPDNGHGTHVSGTIGAVTNNGVGVAGMTWVGSILPVRTLGTGGGTHFQFAQGFMYAAGLLKAPDPVNPTPAQVINYSGGGIDSTTKKDAVAAVDAAGVIMVCAAGNSGGAIDYPAAYSLEFPRVICVGSTNYGNGSPTRAWYSSRGPAMNVAAPGGDTSVDSDGDGNPDGVLSTAWDFTLNKRTYDFWQGTSMATPHVTGLVALMLGVNCPPGLVRSKIQKTATDLGAAGFDEDYGYGLINARKALAAVPKPDLVISYLLGLGAVSRTALESDKVVFKWRVKNKGTIASNETAIKFWLSRNRTLESTDIYLGRKNVAALKGGALTALTKSAFNLSEHVNPNVRWYVIGKVDPGKVIAESDETNNQKSGQLTDI